MIRTICEKHGLSADHIAIIENIDRNLHLIADLVMADVFIDCFEEDGTKAVVVAQARPSNGGSLYDHIIVGEAVLPENEPAVFAAGRLGISIRDIRAVTQEEKIVKQNIVPITDDQEAVIGVLICEYDISRSVQQDKKFRYLAENLEQLSSGDGAGNPEGFAHSPDGYSLNRETVYSDSETIQRKEIHHRVKNNLQMVASILNIQARKEESQELKQVLKENVNRILSIASVHDFLTYQSEENCLSVRKIIQKVVANIEESLFHGEKEIRIRILGDDALLEADKAVSVAVIVNELVTNSLKHGFKDRKEGLIEITVGRGNSYLFITVKDNGVGFSESRQTDGHFGLSLVKMMVDDKLHGSLQIHGTGDGTQITFDFQN